MCDVVMLHSGNSTWFFPLFLITRVTEDLMPNRLEGAGVISFKIKSYFILQKLTYCYTTKFYHVRSWVRLYRTQSVYMYNIL